MTNSGEDSTNVEVENKRLYIPFKKCAAENCPVTTRTHPREKLFCFPCNPERNSQWMEFAKNKTTTSQFLCHRHFDNRQFRDFYRSKLTYGATPSFHVGPLNEIGTYGPPSRKEEIVEPNISLPTSDIPLHPSSDTPLSHQTADLASSSKSLILPSSSHSELSPLPQTPIPSSTDTSQLPIIVSTNYPKPLSTLKLLNVTRVAQLSPRERVLLNLLKKKDRKCSVLLKRLKATRSTLKELLKLQKDPLALLNHLTKRVWKVKLPNGFVTLFASQVRTNDKDPKGIRWTYEEKTLSYAMLKHCPKLYRYLQKIMSLPSTRTLNREMVNVSTPADIDPEKYKTLIKSLEHLEEEYS